MRIPEGPQPFAKAARPIAPTFALQLVALLGCFRERSGARLESASKRALAIINAQALPAGRLGIESKLAFDVLSGFPQTPELFLSHDPAPIARHQTCDSSSFNRCHGFAPPPANARMATWSKYRLGPGSP